MLWKRIALSAALIAALAALPLTPAQARWHRGFPLFWPFVAGAAVVGTAAAVVTAPFRPFYRPYYYGPPAAYYPPPPYYYGPRPYYYGY